MDKVIANVIPDSSITQLHGIAVLRLQEMPATLTEKPNNNYMNHDTMRKVSITCMRVLRYTDHSQYDRKSSKSTTVRLTCIQSSSSLQPLLVIEDNGTRGTWKTSQNLQSVMPARNDGMFVRYRKFKTVRSVSPFDQTGAVEAVVTKNRQNAINWLVHSL